MDSKMYLILFYHLVNFFQSSYGKSVVPFDNAETCPIDLSCANHPSIAYIKMLESTAEAICPDDGSLCTDLIFNFVFTPEIDTEFLTVTCSMCLYRYYKNVENREYKFDGQFIKGQIYNRSIIVPVTSSEDYIEDNQAYEIIKMTFKSENPENSDNNIDKCFLSVAMVEQNDPFTIKNVPKISFEKYISPLDNAESCPIVANCEGYPSLSNIRLEGILDDKICPDDGSPCTDLVYNIVFIPEYDAEQLIASVSYCTDRHYQNSVNQEIILDGPFLMGQTYNEYISAPMTPSEDYIESNMAYEITKITIKGVNPENPDNIMDKCILIFRMDEQNDPPRNDEFKSYPKIFQF